MGTPPDYIGIDVGKASLSVGTTTRILGEFANTPAGHQLLIKRLRHVQVALICIESTGIYGQAIGHALLAAGFQVAMVQPSCVRHFAKSQKVLAKTDAIDACVIAHYGAVSAPRLYAEKPVEHARLRALVTRRQQLIGFKTREDNHLEACQDEDMKGDIRQAIGLYKQQIKALDKKIAESIKRQDDLQQKQNVLTDVTGVGPQTAATLLVYLPELGTMNRQDIAALAGLAPYNNDSGKLKGKRSIYGGRKQLRKALYIAAMTAIRWNTTFKECYTQLRARGKEYKVARIACARKLLVYLNSRLAEYLKTNATNQTTPTTFNT